MTAAVITNADAVNSMNECFLNSLNGISSLEEMHVAVKSTDYCENPDNSDRYRKRLDKSLELYENLPNKDTTVTLTHAKNAMQIVTNTLNNALNDSASVKRNDFYTPKSSATFASSFQSSSVPHAPSLADLPIEALIIAIKHFLIGAHLSIQDSLKVISEGLSKGLEQLRAQAMDKQREQLCEATKSRREAYRAEKINAGRDALFALGKIALGSLIIGFGLGNPLAIAAGATLILSGISGVINSGCEFAAAGQQEQGNAEKAEQFEYAATIARDAEIGFEVLSAVIGGVELAIGAVAACTRVSTAVRSAVTAAEEARGGVAGFKALADPSISSSSIKSLSESMLKEINKISAESWQQVWKNGPINGNLRKVWQKITPEGFDMMPKSIDWEAISTKVDQEALEAIIKKFSKTTSPSKFTSKVTNSLVFNHMKDAVLQSRVMVGLSLAWGTLKAGEGITDGVIKIQISNSRRLIDTIAEEVRLIEQILQRFTQKAMKENLQTLTKNAQRLADGLEDVMKWLKQIAQTKDNMTNTLVSA